MSPPTQEETGPTTGPVPSSSAVGIHSNHQGKDSDQPGQPLTTSYDELGPERGHPGGDWILSAPDTIRSIWGHGDEVAWPSGEALILVGADGTGKTVLAHNLILRQTGLIQTPLLGLPVMPATKVAYLAQDRPVQAKRALKRMVGDMDLEELNHALAVIDWPVGTVEEDPDLLARIAGENNCDTIIVDSLKDITQELSSELTGQAVNRAYQKAITEGVDVLLLHHDRKAGSDSKRRLLKLADVYGSRLMVAGCGSVIALNGVSGDPVVELRQLKHVVAEVGPTQIAFDFTTGEVNIADRTDIVAIVNMAKTPLTAADAAKALYGVTAPTRSDVERARRKLKIVAEKDLIVEVSGATTTAPTRWCSIVLALSEPPELFSE